MFSVKITTWHYSDSSVKRLPRQGMFYNKEQRDPNSLLLYARYSSIVKHLLNNVPVFLFIYNQWRLTYRGTFNVYHGDEAWTGERCDALC